MIKYWCVNFDHPACLEHGIRNKLWLMQYQYADDHGRVFQGNKKGAIRKNWERLETIKPNHWFVAYLKPSTFFAVGKVIKPRRAKTAQDHTNSIATYLEQKRSHRQATGYVYYTSVFYENFTDKWTLPADPLMRYPQRIDVDQWRCYVPNGITREGLLGKVPPYELQKAVFEITKSDFEAITRELLSENGPHQQGNSKDEETDKSGIPEEILTPELFSEGGIRTITVNAYERNPAARKSCINHYGYACAVCDDSMEYLYGSVATGVVHVHHLNELATIGKEYVVDPIADLRPVCPNCHAVLHSSTPALTINELRTIVAKHRMKFSRLQKRLETEKRGLRGNT
jgi:hypothetical protein